MLCKVALSRSGLQRLGQHVATQPFEPREREHRGVIGELLAAAETRLIFCEHSFPGGFLCVVFFPELGGGAVKFVFVGEELQGSMLAQRFDIF